MMKTIGDRFDIKSFFRSEVGTEVYYCPNPGNAGDSAIATSTFDLLDQAGLRCNWIKWDATFDSSGKTVVYGGGGNFTSNYQKARSFIQAHHQKAEKFILLPHTIEGHADVLSQLGPNVSLFCRERRSFEWTCTHTDGPSVYLADDLAFHLNSDKLLRKEFFVGANAYKEIGKILTRSISNGILRRIGINRRGLSCRPTLPAKKALYVGNATFAAAGKRSRLYALRSDVERTSGPLPSSNIDVSTLFSYGVASPETARRATVGMLSFINCYDQIVTNRLHVCILAALLGKKVDFYANSYFKNEEVYQYSIEERFPNVHWRGVWRQPGFGGTIDGFHTAEEG